MPSYLAHAHGERIRFRHKAFARDEIMQRAMEILKKIEGIAGLKPGVNSILVFVEPPANLQAICEKLEQELPEILAQEQEGSTSARKIVRDKSPKANPQADNSPKVNHRIMMRKLELKTLLTCGVTTVGLALFGFKHAHVVAGGVFSILATRHIWQRRRSL